LATKKEGEVFEIVKIVDKDIVVGAGRLITQDPLAQIYVLVTLP